MLVKDVLPGDVLSGRNCNWMVREVQMTSTLVQLLLAAGRTDPGQWYAFSPEWDVGIYRHAQGYPKPITPLEEEGNPGDPF